MGGGAGPIDLVEARLAVLLGPNTARNALKTFSTRALGKPVSELTRDDVPKLLQALRPTLRTLLGAIMTDRVIAEILEEMG
jgi:hypothetical protein